MFAQLRRLIFSLPIPSVDRKPKFFTPIGKKWFFWFQFVKNARSIQNKKSLYTEFLK